MMPAVLPGVLPQSCRLSALPSGWSEPFTLGLLPELSPGICHP